MLEALLLLSGGLDSATALAWARGEGLSILGALSFDYGQRHVREIAAASAVTARHNVAAHTLALI